VSLTPAVAVRVGRVGAASLQALAAICFLGVALPAVAAPVLFPTPLHITREVTDPVTATTTVVDEYCHGNRIDQIERCPQALLGLPCSMIGCLS
jgi:hypothetical protein